VNYEGIPVNGQSGNYFPVFGYLFSFETGEGPDQDKVDFSAPCVFAFISPPNLFSLEPLIPSGGGVVLNSEFGGYSPAQLVEAAAWLARMFIRDLQLQKPQITAFIDLRGNDPEKDARRIRAAIVFCIVSMVRSPPSPGYEPLYIRRGDNPIAARIRAYLIVHEGARIAAASQASKGVADAIRFLARAGRSRRSIAKRIEALCGTLKQPRIIGALFLHDGLSGERFISLLPLAAQGDENATGIILEIAARAAQKIKLPRGPKVSAASASHELFVESQAFWKTRGYTYSPYKDDFVDEATQATRLEFPDEAFDPRPATRRMKARWRLAAESALAREGQVAA
jgi:hypothetical protein